ncbi:MAG: hypothetical protein KAS32_15960 [Candidatus Peribacteraceae bacterium]|nr:hypothetical protein [Candidatus Peribacteraceae bacterium]
MGITAKETKPKELTPAGSHVARCYKMMHYGHVPDTYMGELKIVNIVRVDFELPNEMRVFNEESGAQPMSISKKYTLSLSDGANLRKDLESWRGEGFTKKQLAGFDITKVIGAPCLISVIHKTSAKGNKYAMIASISPLVQGMEAPPAINTTFIWDYENNFDLDILENLHDYYQNIIKSSEEYKDIVSVADPDVQDVPMPNENDLPEAEHNDNNDLPF